MAGEMIQIPIKFPATATRGEFNDAIYVSQVAFAAMTPAQVETAKQARYTAWTAHIDAQNVINRDPAVIAQRETETIAHAAEMVRHVIAQPSFDATLTAIIAAVRTGAITPADVRARLFNAALGPINPTPLPNLTPLPNTPLGGGMTGMQ